MRNSKVTGLLSITLLLGLLSTFAAAQEEEEEARYKDTPYFLAMPMHGQRRNRSETSSM